MEIVVVEARKTAQDTGAVALWTVEKKQESGNDPEAVEREIMVRWK